MRLWIAYGLGILFSAIAAAIGLLALIANGVSYSPEFSTIYRLALGARTDVDIKREDLDGTDPLPAYLSKARIWLDAAGDPQKQGLVVTVEGGEENRAIYTKAVLPTRRSTK